METANLLTVHVIRLHGIPSDIVSDCGPQFISQVWREFCKALGATASLSSGFHPQTNGQTERANQELEAALRCMTSAIPSPWSTMLPWIEYAHNSLPCSVCLSPFEDILGYQPPLFPAHETELAVPSVQDLIYHGKEVWTGTQRALERSQQSAQDSADRHRKPTPSINQVSLFASLLKIFRFSLNPVSSHLVTSVHFPSWKLSTLLQLNCLYQ